MTTFLKSSAEPIRCIAEYVIQIKFQARGSPHAHTLFWIKDVLKLGYSQEQDVQSFIDKYVSCSLPDNDEGLRNLVEKLQIHRHSQISRSEEFHFGGSSGGEMQHFMQFSVATFLMKCSIQCEGI